LRKRREAECDALFTIIAKAEARGDTMLASEARQFEKHEAKIAKLDKKIKPLAAEQDRRDKAARAVGETLNPAGDSDEPLTRSRVYVGAESSVYRPDARDYHGNEFGFFSDIVLAQRGDWAAVDRQRRYQAEARALEQRTNPNTTAGTGGEFAPPLWLVDKYQKYLRPSRPTADRCTSFPLPPGVASINIPRIKLGSLAAAQTANATAVSSRDMTTDSVAAPVLTVAGQVDISMQLLDQSPIAMDGVVFEDLAADIAKQVDNLVLSGSGANGQPTGLVNVASIGSVTFTSGSPDAVGT
jgi:HK97 family phage major capsid protein